MRFITTCSPGLEPLLKEELDGLLKEKTRIEGTGALSFESENWLAPARVLLASRLASRLLLSLRKFSAKTPQMLYDQVRRVVWTDFIPDGATFAIATHGTKDGQEYPLSFATLKIKDAICDEIKKLGRLRPSIDKKTPDVRLEAFFDTGKCELSVDLAGFPLHRRGYRWDGAEAPLRENRAAALLAFAGYTGKEKLMDPFCGSGTIVIEAALIAQHRAPGLARKIQDFSVSKFIPEAAKALENELHVLSKEAEKFSSEKPEIFASDNSPTALDSARANASRAKVTRCIHFNRLDARSLVGENLFIVCNPPYGERFLNREEAPKLLAEFTRQVKHHCPESKMTLILAADKNLEKAVGLRPSKKLTLENGPVQARFLTFELYKGSRK